MTIKDQFIFSASESTTTYIYCDHIQLHICRSCGVAADVAASVTHLGLYAFLFGYLVKKYKEHMKK